MNKYRPMAILLAGLAFAACAGGDAAPTPTPTATPVLPTPTPVPPTPNFSELVCEAYLGLLISTDDAEEQAVVTSYQCVSLFIDSTGRYPSKSPSLIVPQGEPFLIRLQAEQQPMTVEVRLYPEAGISGSFGHWPEQLPRGREPVDRFKPTPSLTFQYLPQVPTGEYSIVVRATWEGPIDVFYAMSLRLQ